MVTTTTTTTITELLQTYFNGLFAGDVSRLRQVFHPEARLTGMVRGEPYARALPEYLDAVAQRASPESRGEQFRMRIESIDEVGDIALARVHCPMLGFNYTDFLSLRREDGRWSIVHKLFTHVGS